MNTEHSRSKTLFGRMRPGIVAGFITGLLIGPGGALVSLFISWGIRDSFLVMYPLTYLTGFCGGSIIGPLGGLLGAFLAIKTGKENLIIVFGVLGAILLLIPFIILLT